MRIYNCIGREKGILMDIQKGFEHKLQSVQALLAEAAAAGYTTVQYGRGPWIQADTVRALDVYVCKGPGRSPRVVVIWKTRPFGSTVHSDPHSRDFSEAQLHEWLTACGVHPGSAQAIAL